MNMRLVHRALIERNRTLAADAYGQPAEPMWYAHIVSQPCYFWEPTAQRGEQIGERNADLYSHRLLLPLTVDVTEEDRVNGIRDRRRRTINAGVFAIQQIVRKPDHLLLVLEAVQS